MATVKKKNKDPLKSKTEWTITEFQMWLAGAYSLQGEDWVPNPEQWEMILDIIYKLKDRKTVAQQPQRPLQQPQPVVEVPPPGGYGGPAVQPSMGGSSLLNAVDSDPPEAAMPLSKLRERSAAGGIPGANQALGPGKPGEREVKLGSFE